MSSICESAMSGSGATASAPPIAGRGRTRCAPSRLDLHLPRLIRAHPVPRPDGPVLRRLDAPVADRRPTLLVAVLLATIGAVLFVRTLYTYFGLTAGNSFVSGVVGIAVVLWFAALSAAYRFRLLDRLLGLEQVGEHAGRW